MKINFIYTPDVGIEQMIGYEIASIIYGQLFTDDIEVNILAKNTDELESGVIGGAMPEFHEQHYALFLQYYEADITSEEDQIAFDALQEGNTVDFLLDGDLVGGNTKLKLTTALAKALGMTEAISLERYVLDESANFIDGTIMMSQDFTWDFNYLRSSEAAADTLDFMSVALHETGHILGFTSSLDFSLQEETLYSGRTELSNFSPLDLFRFSAESLALDNPDGTVNDLSIGGAVWFSPDGGETLTAKMSTGKEGDGFQASHWERRYDPLGIMDPTLWYQERATITDLDVLAFDLMGYDLSEEAADVEQLFETQNLEVLLAQAKVQLANKMDYSLEDIEQYLEDKGTVPLSDPELLGNIATDDSETLANGDDTPEAPSDLDSGSDDKSLDAQELQDFFKDLDNMMGDFYEWWGQNNGGGSGWWQEVYEWWGQNNGGGSGWWQEAYEWWAQNNGGGSGSWQELYEWWGQNNGGGSGWWQEVYEWWNQDNGGGSSWWQEVFFASQDGGNLEDLLLPGEKDNTTGPAYEQKIKGGKEDDIIGGDISDDLIKGKKGDDLIDGAEGDDTIFGGGDFDTIFGFDGNDSIMGGGGHDFISGESDNDVLFGESGSDILMGGDHNDYLDGGKGRDFLSGDTGDDVLIGAAGDDALEGGSGKDLLVGGAGEDIGNGGSGDDYIYGDEYAASLQEAFGNNLNNLTNNFTPAVDTDTTETSGGDNTNTNNTDNVVLAQDPLRVEAESMSWTGDYEVKNRSFASGGSLIQHYEDDEWITGSTTFTGETGTYKIIIGYHDIEDESGEIQVELNGAPISNWNLTKDLGDDELEAANFTTYTINNVPLSTNDSLTIKGIVEDEAEGAIDYIEFEPVVNNTPIHEVVLDQDPNTIENDSSPEDVDLPPDPISITPEIELGLNSDVLRGGAGNDGIDGGEGNDIIFGEDELNDSSNITAPLINGVKDYGHSSYILSQAATLEEAQTEAQNYGGYLVIIDDIAEQQWLIDNLGFDANNDYVIEIDWSSVGGNDTIFGGAGDDQIYGNSGNDIIYGDNGTIVPKTPGTFSFQQGVNGYNGTVDTFIEESRASLDRSNTNHLNIDQSTGNNDEGQAQGLLKFEDIFGSQSGQIALDDTINSAFLEINVFDPGNSIEVYNMLQSWSDSATWNSLDNGIQANGTEAANTSVATTVSGTTGIITIDVTASLQAWQADSNSNQGWAFLPTGMDGFDFDSAEGNIAPRLVVNVNQESSPVSNINDTGAITVDTSSLPDGTIHNGSLYIVNETKSDWEEAQAYAESLGGNLVTINDATEQSWLETTFDLGTGRRYWIGLNDKAVEGQFKWVSGEESTYTNWDYVDHQQPNNSGSSGGPANYVSTQIDNPRWNDGDLTQEYRSIIEIKLNTTSSDVQVPIISGGNDNIFGNGGHDIIRGGAGDDAINGTDGIVAGYLERDTLEGGAGTDKFILGDETQAFYATGGAQDYAVIEDFNFRQDSLEVYGSLATDYLIASQVSDVHLSYNGDLVAIFKNSNTIIAPNVTPHNLTITKNVNFEKISLI